MKKRKQKKVLELKYMTLRVIFLLGSSVPNYTVDPKLTSPFSSFLHRDDIEDEPYLFGDEKLTEREIREFR
jgi:hypothetical protein